MAKLKITEHAEERAKDRVSLSSAAIERLAKKAWDKGYTWDDSPHELKMYISRKVTDDADIRVYGENIFIFKNRKLVTVYSLPTPMRTLMRKIRNKKVAA